MYVKIQSISQNSLTGVALEGVADAIKLFMEVIVPGDLNMRKIWQNMKKNRSLLRLI